LFYGDIDRQRPGLPPDIAALVETRTVNSIQFQLVNINPLETRRIAVYAGSLRQHKFGVVEVESPVGSSERHPVVIDNGLFEVMMPPLSAIRLICSLRQYVNPPAYIRVGERQST
jgi:hypothetical protein